MEIFLPDYLLKLLVISMTFSIFLMAMIQKIKASTFINKKWQIWLLNLTFSFLLGIPFSICFYDLDLIAGIWISLFSFIGAPTLYEALKNQKFINYKPRTLSDNISDESENKSD